VSSLPRAAQRRSQPRPPRPPATFARRAVPTSPAGSTYSCTGNGIGGRYLKKATALRYYYSIGTLSLVNQNRSMSFNGCVCDTLGLASGPPLEADAWLAVGRRPLGRRLPPRDPLRVRPRCRDRAELEACMHEACSRVGDHSGGAFRPEILPTLLAQGRQALVLGAVALERANAEGISGRKASPEWSPTVCQPCVSL
jgi:hypothetical protein